MEETDPGHRSSEPAPRAGRDPSLDTAPAAELPGSREFHRGGPCAQLAWEPSGPLLRAVSSLVLVLSLRKRFSGIVPTLATETPRAGTIPGLLTTASRGLACTCTRACAPSRFSRVQLVAALWTVAQQAPPSMGFSRQEYWSGLPCPPPGDLPNPGIEPWSLPLQVILNCLSHQGSPCST